MMNSYEMQLLRDDLLLIRWNAIPNREDGLMFIRDLRNIYDAAPSPIYTIADLRHGHIKDMGIIMKLSELSNHPNHGGGITFGGDLRADAYVTVYERLAHPGNQRRWQPSFDSAVVALEHYVPGITQNIDWGNVLE